MRGLPNQTGYGTYSYGYSSSLIAFAPTGETAYFAGGAVYKTVDAGNTWSVLSGSPVNASGVAVSYQNPNVVYAASSTGLFISKDAGATWSLGYSDGVGALSKFYIPESVAVDPENGSIVVVGDPFCGCLDRSTDGGFNVTQLKFDFLTPLSVWHLHSYLMPSGRIAMAILTDSSLYASFDFGTTWAQFAQGLPSNSLTSFCLSAQGNGFVATYGYGLWEWRNLSAAFDAAPIKGPISARLPGPPPFPTGIVIFAALGAAAVGVGAVLARRRRRWGGRKG